MGLLTDDMDIRDTELSMDFGGNGDYYLSLKETKRGKVIRLDIRIALSGGNATPDVISAIANLYKALNAKTSCEWMPDKTTSATRCIKCGKDRWAHEL
jgi:hypothetical protein